MKITIELPDELVLQAMKVGGEIGLTLGDLVVDGLRAEIEKRSSAVRTDFHFTTVAGSGLQIDIEPGQFTERAYDLSR